MPSSCIRAVVVVTMTVLASSASAQTYDHLLCYKAKADKAFTSATVDLDAVVAANGLDGCTLKAKLKQICIPVDKTVVSLVDGSPLAVAGDSDALQSICYSVKCPSAPTIAEGTYSDQFGSHDLTKFKPSMVCAPAVTGVPPTCVPSAEVCNNLDDDCNDQIDDGLGSTSCGVGACQTTVNNCVGGMPTSCTPGFPGAEVCNGSDDDCDGMTDEDLGSTSCGVGQCARTVANCESGLLQSCTPGSPEAETCDGEDDNCDGSTDEGLGSTSCGVGACATSVPNCIAGVPQTCVPGTPSAEVCNGIDDNCDGVTDEGC